MDFLSLRFSLVRVIRGQKKSGAAAPHSKTSVLSVQSVVNSLSARERRPAFAKATAWLAGTALFWGERVYDLFEARLPPCKGVSPESGIPSELFQLG